MDSTTRGTVALLYGGSSNERQISILSGKAVEKSLKKLGYKVINVDVDKNFVYKITKTKFDFAFVALHGKYGEDGRIQGVLDLMNIPYTHSGVLACSVCMDKICAKSVFSYLGIEVAPGRATSKKEILSKKTLHNKKHVIKPVSDGSSFNVYIFENEHNFTKENYPFDSDVMLEEFIDGKEIQVAVVCGKAIGAVEIIPKQSAFYDYKTKYTEGMAKQICPAEIPSTIYKTCLDQSKKVYDFLKCKGASRADFIYDTKKNRLVMLEFNTHPGFTNLSLVPEIALKCKGITFDQLVEKIILDIKR